MKAFLELRPLHQKYIMDFRENIIYGGIIINDDGLPKSIHIYMEAENKETVQKIMENDPIFPLYQDIQIEKFIQRIPSV